MILSFYRPQRSWGKVMFLHVSVILFTGGGSPGPHPGGGVSRPTPRRGVSQHALRQTPLTAATGMHSCFLKMFA